MAFLRAFVDDSAAQTGDRRLFLAGYLARADAWAMFSDAWDAELKAWPKIDYFKAAEANNLDGQFHYKNGWDEEKRNAKVGNLVDIIKHFQPLSFEFSVNRKLFEEELKPVSPRGFGNPHFHLCFFVMAGIANYAAQEGIATPIEFIFDEQDGVDDDVRLFFEHMLDALPPDARKLIDGTPFFKNDRDHRYLPLQAADMLAWHIRRAHETGVRLPRTDDLLNRDGHLISAVPDETVRGYAKHHGALPGIASVQSRGDWKRVKNEIRRLQDAGIDPSKIKGPGIYFPEGTPLIGRLIARLGRLFRRG